MVKIDPKLQAQVWQRVQGEQKALPAEHRMALLEAEVAVQIQALMGYYPKHRPALQQMLGVTRKHLACLQGMDYLRRGERSRRAVGKVRNQEGTAVIRKCYVNCLNLANLYEQGRADPEYGVVYGELAREMGEQCQGLLLLAGQ